MKKTLLFALPFAALMLSVGCKKQEAAVTPEQPVAAVAPEQPVTATTLPAVKPVEQKPVAAKPVAKKSK